ncbi:CGNR zinc finger domain-containing protein [Kineosporia mesophila]|uniref:CGNR zinc finger domain-containing protein n=1 Tax=Kineosporia mesophila TaxID=566012 RepID=A0ABP7AER6_9ACTN|nr:CGNR zinc finger domain-containing protein [Kineosporia mesophila]MCD5352859.1 CGNR zinc finger domain-containing protein [Kineosporia mesophila]
MPGFAATERLSTSVAPDSLLLTQELLNTQGPLIYRIDLLDETGTAQEWLDGVLDDWQAVNPGQKAARIQLRDVDLAGLATVRDQLYGLVTGESDVPVLESPVTVTAGPDGVQASPGGTGIGWISSAVALELFRAQEQDLLRRLKRCQNPDCATVFYDRSKNNSRSWHDVATCGNRANVRAYRARQKDS